MNNRRNNSYSSYVNMPGSSARPSHRGPLGILLTLLIPPLGLMYLWRNGIFRTRGRMLLTVVATLEMALVIFFAMPRESVIEAMPPMPAAASRVSPAPESDVLTALSNMDQLLREQQTDVVDTDSGVNRVSQAESLAAQQDVLNTVVYAVYDSGARYYHSVTVCGNQSNLRTLTIMEAIQEGLGACSRCDPPAYSPHVESASADEAPENAAEPEQ